MYYVYICFVLAFSLQVFDYSYHRKDLSSIKFDREPSFMDLRKTFKNLSYKKLDNYFAIFPFLWSYLYIVGSVILFHQLDNFIVRFSLILFVTGRIRSLQEISHFAVHGALCPNLKYSMLLANVFYQFPAFMPEAKVRRKTHVLEHHNSVNMEHDPDLKELTDKGFNPGITRFQFWLKLFYYLTPDGIFSRIKECWGYIIEMPFSLKFYLRIVVIFFVMSVFISLKLYKELFFLYLVPVFVTYPLFYWLAHVALHRWFVRCDDNIEYYQRELIVGRPTNFSGVLGFIIKHNLFPVGDSYHLAHSLFPTIRWTYLPQVDSILKKYCKQYGENASFGLFIPSNGYPSVFSELEERLVIDNSYIDIKQHAL